MNSPVMEPPAIASKAEDESLQETVAAPQQRAPAQRRKVLAVASGGGHWVQLRRLDEALKNHNVAYVSVNDAYRCDVGSARFYSVLDATAWNKFKLVVQALQVLFIVWRERPEIVISTGAAPGYFALRFGKWFGAHTVWIDSIANVERLSLSGRKAQDYADLWLTQWKHLAVELGPSFRGAVL